MSNNTESKQETCIGKTFQSNGNIRLVKCNIHTVHNWWSRSDRKKAFVVETEKPVQYNGKLEKGNLKSTLPRSAVKVKSDSSITVINKLRILCAQDELADEVINVNYTSSFSLTDVTNTGNGERGTGNGSLGTNIQRQPAWEFKMAVKTKERLEEKQFG